MTLHSRLSRKDLRSSTLARALVAWGGHSARDFPWRSSESGYLLALAEVLLRKTRAQAVTPVYERLVRRFPAPKDLLRSTDEELSQIVGPLGLKTERLRQLRIVGRHFTSTRRSIRDAGLGPYATAALSVSLGGFGVPVDGNIARVTARVAGIRVDRGELRKNKVVHSVVADLFAAAVAGGLGRQVFHALLDVSAAFCSRTKPSCSACPLRVECQWATTQFRS